MAAPPVPDDVIRRTLDAMEKCGGNQGAASEMLGISRGGLQGHLRMAARRGMLAPGNATEVMEGFEITRVQTGPRGTTIEQKPEPSGTFEIPEGHRIKGVSAFIDPDGRVRGQWVKTREGEFDPQALVGIQERLRRIRGTDATGHRCARSLRHPSSDAHSLQRLEWAFEVKWDGYRLAAHVEPGEVRAITRGGYGWTRKFGLIVAEARQLGHASMILDGEVVVLDEQGRSDFGLLQRAVGKKPSLHEPSEIIFYAFDLLYLNGHDLRTLPLAERRRRLEPIIAGRTGAIRFSEEIQADGAEFFRAACELSLEGIIAKRLDKPYHSGHRPEWLKIKCARRDWFLIVGYEPSTVPGGIGRLLLAARKGESLVYVGGCGTGWSNQESVALRELLNAIPAEKPPVGLKRKGAVFARPLLIAEVEYRAWTQDGKLRHPSFKGVREMEGPSDVYEINAQLVRTAVQ